jgi:hypothetical protein
MSKGFLIALLALFSTACTQKMICPAYQSSFIYDKETLRKKFSYFNEDSTPKVFASRQSKYLVAVPESYRKKLRSLRTVEMQPVYPVIPDSLKINKDVELLLAETDVADSVAAPADSVETEYAITKTKEKYNLDQDLYMWYFRKLLVMPDVRVAMESKQEQAAEQKKATAKKEKRSGRKNRADSLQTKSSPSDTTATKKKRGLFGGKKKAKDTPSPEGKPKDKAPAKKEDEGDGF